MTFQAQGEVTESGLMQRSQFWFTTLLLGLGFAVPGLVVDWTQQTGDAQNILLAWLIVLIAAIRLAYETSRPRGKLLHVGTYIFIYVFVGIASLAQTAAGLFPLDGRVYSSEEQTTQLVVLLVGVIGLEVGQRIITTRSGEPQDSRGPMRGWAPLGVSVVGGIGLVTSGNQIASNGLAQFFLSRTETARILAGQAGDEPLYTVDDKLGIALQTGFSQYTIFLALFAILYSRHHGLWQPVGPARLYWNVLSLALVATNVVVNNPIGNSRLWGLLVIFGFVSIYWDFRNPRYLRRFVIASVGVLLLVFPLLDAFRFTNGGRDLTFEPRDALALNESYPVFQMALNGGQYVSNYGHTDGQQLLTAVFAFVPRSLWEGKAIPTGQLVDPRFLRSASAWTEAYVDFGAVGVLVLFIMLGTALARLSQRWLTVRPGMFHALVPLVTIYSFFILRGSLLPAMASLYQLAFIIGLCAIGRRVPTSTLMIHRQGRDQLKSTAVK